MAIYRNLYSWTPMPPLRLKPRGVDLLLLLKVGQARMLGISLLYLQDFLYVANLQLTPELYITCSLAD